MYLIHVLNTQHCISLCNQLHVYYKNKRCCDHLSRKPSFFTGSCYLDLAILFCNIIQCTCTKHFIKVSKRGSSTIHVLDLGQNASDKYII